MKRGSSSGGLGVALLGLLVSVSAAAQANPGAPVKPAPKLAFEEEAVAASGLTPGGKAAWFSVAREAIGTGSLIVRREEVTDSNVDGTARFELDQPVPPRSMWTAVDLVTGDYVLATPGDYPLRQMSLPLGAFRLAAADTFDRLFAQSRELVEVLVVRPNLGAWVLTTWDGAPDDEDGPANLRLSFAFSRMEPVGGSPAAPAALQPGDVVILMDPSAMQVAAAKLPGGGK